MSGTEQATGVLTARIEITVIEALSRMRAHARREGVTLTSVASTVIEGSFDVRSLAAG